MPARTLNLGILAHIDAGKTSLTERLLYDSGAIAELGSVDAGSTQTDTNELERERGITIRSAVAPFLIDDLQVNLVDTPGHPDFIAEVERALSVLDGAILVLSAVEGVQAQTRVLMRSLRRLGLPTLLFLNKIDRMGARTEELLADIRRKLATDIVPLSSVVDPGTPDAQAVALSWHDGAVRGDIAEALAEHDDQLLERLVAGQTPKVDELRRFLTAQTAAGLVYPVFFGSAVTGAGTSQLVTGIRTLLPSPDPAEVAADDPSGTVFAIERAGSGEKIAYLRLFRGQLRERQRITFRRREPSGRITEFAGRVTGLEVVGGRLSDRAAGASGRPAQRSRLNSGSIGKLRGVPEIRVGDQLGDWVRGTGEPQFSPPSLESVVRPVHPEQRLALHAVLTSLADEDPLIRTRGTAGGETSLLLYGAVQREVIAARLLRDFSIEAVFEQVRPVYFERPAGTGEWLVEMDRRSNVFWATIGLRVEPAPIGAGNSFQRKVEWGALPRAFHRSIEDAALNALNQGLYGWEVIDCVVTLYRVRWHAPISTAADFRNLTPLVLMRALQLAGTHTFEPCQQLEVDIPVDVVSGVLSALSGLGADIIESVEKGDGWTVSAQLPARLVPEFTMTLPGLSHGEGAVWSGPAPDRQVRGRQPLRERFDGNPLNYEEYLRWLSDRSLGSTAVASESG